MRIALVIALLPLIGPALAASPCDGVPELGPLAAKPIIFQMHPDLIRPTCDPYYQFNTITGCADEEANVIYLTSPDALRDTLGWSDTEIACLEKHEQAHLWHSNGSRWSRDHSSIVSR